MSRTIGRYEIRSIAGRGAMGTVYEAWDPQTETRVAVKTLGLAAADADALGQQLLRFQREAEIARGLVHPNIVQVFDSGQTDQEAYLVMEFVDGQSLKDMLESGKKFALPDTLGLMGALLAGLGYSHSRGVVHRDIKPANLMIAQDGVVKIADFGVARLEGSTMTQTGVMVGTPAYMSPEQFLGEPVDARSDVYSAGALLFQLLTGEKPFDGGMASIIYKALHTTLPKPSGLSIQAPPVLDAVVARAMARNPSDRYPDAAAFAQALNAAMSETTLVVERPAAPAAPPPPPAVRQPAPMPGTPRIADLTQIPAYVEPPSNPAQQGGGMGGIFSLVLLVAVVAGAAVLVFDLYTNQPIGTLPSLQTLTQPNVPLPGNNRPYR